MTVCGTANAVVFSTDFESGLPSEITGENSAAENVAGTQGFSAFAGTSFLWNNSDNFSDGPINRSSKTTLTITGLPANGTIDLNFDLALIESWDGETAGGENLVIDVNGNNIFSESYYYIDDDAQQTIDASPHLITQKIQKTDVFAGGLSGFADSLYYMEFEDIVYTGTSVTIDFYRSGPGAQGGSNESFGLDNISVAIPEPGTYTLGLSALVLLILIRRRKV